MQIFPDLFLKPLNNLNYSVSDTVICRYFQTSFCFLKKLFYEVKAIVLILFHGPSTWHTIKTNSELSDYWSKDILNFYVLEKSLVIVFLPHLCMCFQMFWDVGRYMHRNYLLIKPFSDVTRVKTKVWISW